MDVEIAFYRVKIPSFAKKRNLSHHFPDGWMGQYSSFVLIRYTVSSSLSRAFPGIHTADLYLFPGQIGFPKERVISWKSIS